VTQATALITGISGQDGSYLADFLLTQGYPVVGVVRRIADWDFKELTPIDGRTDCQSMARSCLRRKGLTEWISSTLLRASR